MAAPDNVILVPKPSRESYKPHRPLSRNLLIKAQLHHFHEADLQLPEEYRTGMDINLIHTEGQASAYIRKVTEAIHKSGGHSSRVRTAT
ncbi:MAG: hypothetical protein M3Y72_11450 [Acidobacteriota bacterium]|nr:hypothetical protein [Acidobacteriota bacterium]